MKTGRITMAVLAWAVLLPLAAEAQTTYRIMQRGVLGIMTEAATTAGAPETTARVIIDVVPESPAARAGVMRGDTLIAINRRAATEDAMRAQYEPGDTVLLSVRRDGREHEFTVVATARTAAFQTLTVNALPDSVRRQIEVIMDAVRVQADTLHMRNLTIERLRGDSAIVFRFGDDSTRAVHMRAIAEGAFNLDSLRARGIRLDSVRHFIMRDDSVRARILRRDGTTIMLDSLPGLPEGRIRMIPFRGDSLPGMLPAEIFASGFTIGMRAIAGAELSDLNPGLSAYFGVTDGVLVLNAREGTPAALAGIAAGDVIVQVNGRTVASIAEMRAAFDAAGGPGTAVPVRVVRRGQNVDLTLTR
jgi:membrane-associated protease RseP (regulator of RpoE activity)